MTVVAVTFNFSGYIKELFKLDLDTVIIKWSIAFFVVYLLFDILIGIAQAYKIFDFINRINLAIVLLYLIIIFVARNNYHVDFFYFNIFQASLYSACCLIILYVLRLNFNLGRRIVLFKYQDLKLFIYYSLPTYFSNLSAFMMYRSDLFVVNYFLGPSFTGIYFISVSITEKLNIFSNSIAAITFPYLVEGNKLNTIFIFKYTIYLLALIAIFLFFFIEYFVKIFLNKEFLGSVSLIQVMLPGVVFLGLSKILANKISAINKPGYNFIASFFALLINHFLNFLLIPKFGLLAAAFSTTLSYLLLLLLCLIFYSKLVEKIAISDLIVTKSDIQIFKNLILRS